MFFVCAVTGAARFAVSFARFGALCGVVIATEAIKLVQKTKSEAAQIATRAARSEGMPDISRDPEVALLFFGQRHLAAVADEPLTVYGMGRAHHRALFFIGRRPGVTAQGLRAILQITTQSLHRVMTDLLKAGFIEQRQSQTDRREKLLFLTRSGAKLERECARRQKALLDEAAVRVGAEAIEGFRRTLFAMIAEDDRPQYAGLDI